MPGRKGGLDAASGYNAAENSRAGLGWTASRREKELDVKQEVARLLDQVLGLNGRSAAFEAATPLLGAVPELDSMAVVAVITALEEDFGFVVEDDDIDGSTFATFGSLVEFVEFKLAA